ncbi:hypothetical protein LFL97_12350 [Burkholderia sp. JSH-S8]|nr:hypothetical protein LFL97_12350 [Burkholderia sp. JSH-S8]
MVLLYGERKLSKLVGYRSGHFRLDPSGGYADVAACVDEHHCCGYGR